MARHTEKYSGRAQALEDAKSGKMPEPLEIPLTHALCSKCNRIVLREDVDKDGRCCTCPVEAAP